MSTGLALWLTLSCLMYHALGGWVRTRGSRVLLALLWPLGVALLVLLHIAEDIRKMVNRL